MADSQNRILVADDEITSQYILRKFLEGWGYEVVTCGNGNDALEILRGQDPPRIALLDWMMPGLSGIEVCKRILQRESVCFIYTILITAKSESEDVVMALEAGAHDFITKPFDKGILRSRIRTGLRLVNEKLVLDEVHEVVKQYATQMEALAAERAKQLIHADRMVSLGILSAGIAHEINNPMSFISGNVQTMERFWNDTVAIMRNQSPVMVENNTQLKFIVDEMPKALLSIKNGVSRVSRIVQGLKGFARLEKGEKRNAAINECVRQALEIAQPKLKNVKVSQFLEESLPDINLNQQEIEQVILNLLINAADAMVGRAEQEIILRTQKKNGNLLLEVQDSGTGIPPEHLDNIWNPFFTTKEIGQGTGLGLSICLGIIKDHGGEIEVKNVDTGGALFRITLPIATMDVNKK